MEEWDGLNRVDCSGLEWIQIGIGGLRIQGLCLWGRGGRSAGKKSWSLGMFLVSGEE